MIWTDDKKLRILELRKQNVSYEVIAKEFDTTTANISSVITRMRKQGYDILTKNPWTQEEELQFLDLREKGIGYQEISSILGKSYHSVKKKGSELIAKGIVDNYRPTLARFSKEELDEAVRKYISCETAPVSIRHAVKKMYGSWTAALDALGVVGNIGGIFDPAKSTTLYFLDFGEFKKIGITQQQIKSRFSGAPPYIVLDQCVTDLENAIYLERELKKVVEQYIPEHPWFERNGKTECFKSEYQDLESLFSAVV